MSNKSKTNPINKGTKQIKQSKQPTKITNQKKLQCKNIDKLLIMKTFDD